MNVEKGFRGKLSSYIDTSQPLGVKMSVSGSGSYDCRCFLIDESGSAKEHELSQNIVLDEIPQSVSRIVFTVNGNMSEISEHTINVNDVLSFSLTGGDFSGEKAIVSAEIYRKNGEWRFAAVGSGFNGGLDELMKDYGVRLFPANTKPVELRKHQKVNLEKPSGTGEILINLNWHKGESSGGFFSSIFGGRKSGAIDLDLGCLYELKDGTKGAIQSLGNHFGSLERSPYVELDGDDRTGEVSGGENLRVNGRKIYMIKRILVYTFIYEGIVNWCEADGVVTVKCPGNRDVIVRMDEYDTSDGMCALVMLENVNDESLSVERLVRFFNGHEQMDRYYHWGLRWVFGKK